MIVAEDADRFRLVPQPDHAHLTGQIARHWGNERFERPAPDHSMIIAAEDHDRGWRQYDLAPSIHPDGARPLGFREYPGEEWTTVYRSGVENTVAIDTYAGLLVSLHGTGLRRQGYGARCDIPDMHDDPVYADFIAEQEQLQKEVVGQLNDDDRFSRYVSADDLAFLEEIHETGAYSGHCRTWHNYLLLEIYDRLSLYLCENTPLPETTLGPVPITDGTEDSQTELHVVPTDEMAVRIEPYPFDTSPMTVSVSGRYVPKTFETQDQLTERYYRSERERLQFTIHE
ncbi:MULTISPECIES: DUF3891 family protein [Halococcus]|uniref:DUF3891 domain-containing protein n=1 Tax=Halococcus salifodinae DSM 8989 TaxID=1227456 RepID=M0N3J4_9EURY|nr:MULTISPECIES: DUF3891 family protein [Halococcus]EMA52492.1 hypothetical protein C450_10353 [Halococcus salifodinae DSM 8989]